MPFVPDAPKKGKFVPDSAAEEPSQKDPYEGMSFTDRVIDSLKVAGKQGAALGAGVTEAVAGVPGLFADYPFHVYSVITGKPVQTPTQSLTEGLNQAIDAMPAGVKEPSSVSARFLGQLAGGVAFNPVGAVMPASKVPANFRGDMTGVQEVAEKGAKLGLKVNPSDPNLAPSWMTRMLGKASSGPRLDDKISRANQAPIAQVVSNASELKAGEPLTREALATARERIGQAYANARAAQPLAADSEFVKAAENPSVARAIMKRLGSLTEASADDAVTAWQKLRDEAAGNYASIESGIGKRTVNRENAESTKAAADAVKAWIDRSLRKQGMEAVADDFASAPQRIAQSHTLSGAVVPGAKVVDASVLARELQNDTPLRGQVKTLGEFATSFPRNSRSPLAAQPNTHGETNAMIGNLAATTGAQIGGGSIAAGTANLGRATGIPLIRNLADALLMRNSLQRSATGQAPLPSMMNDKEAQARAILAWLASQENR